MADDEELSYPLEIIYCGGIFTLMLDFVFYI